VSETATPVRGVLAMMMMTTMTLYVHVNSTFLGTTLCLQYITNANLDGKLPWFMRESVLNGFYEGLPLHDLIVVVG